MAFLGVLYSRRICYGWIYLSYMLFSPSSVLAEFTNQGFQPIGTRTLCLLLLAITLVIRNRSRHGCYCRLCR